MGKEITKEQDELIYSCQEVLDKTSLNEGEKFYINKKYNGNSMSKTQWLILFENDKLEHVKFLI